MPNTYHEATKHSYWSVRSHPNYLDWSKQPIPFKIYENFPLLPLDLQNPIHKFIYFLGGITAKKSYPGVEYYLRTVPSAGALYPVEIYFQARGVDGFKDGIYHFDVAHGGVRLLYELGEDEGVEVFFEDSRMIEGFVVLYSAIYWRSSWKYKNRAFRYCLLDAGHALGALEVAAFWKNHGYFVRYRFDKVALNECFGFEGREFFLSSAVFGKFVQQEAKSFQMELPFVDGTHTFEANKLIEKAYQESVELKNCRLQPRFPNNLFVKEKLEEAIVSRRSIREFASASIKKEQLGFVLSFMQNFIPSDCDEEVKIWYVVNRVDGMESGLYLNGELVKSGDFSARAGYLCLEQALGSESAVTFFLTSSGQNYQPLYQKAGFIGHRCYISATYLGLGASGIGAYYDDEVREFLGSKDMVLYALALG